MANQETYEAKFITIQEALSKIHTGDTIATSLYGSEPRNLLRQLHTIRDQVEHVTVWVGNPAEEYPFLSDDTLAGKIDVLCTFYGQALRKNHASQRISYVPHNMHSISQTMLAARKPTVFLAAVPPMDDHGYVCVSMSQQMEREMPEAADLVIFEVNEKLPQTCGTVRIPQSKVDFFVKTEGELSNAPEYPVTVEQQTIAQSVASLIRDGDTIQLGIGGLPNAVANALMQKKDLGVHTEMFSDAMSQLMAAGVINNTRKNFHLGQSVCAFTWGSNEFYRYIDQNPLVQVLPANYVNDPFVIAKNNNMVSVNTALQIDLTGQVCSESLGFQQFSGTGGAFDFAYGAFHSKGGRGILAISSTAQKGTVSRIQPGLAPGAVVSISRNIVDYVVTEYGIANLRSKSIRQRRDALISIAHPDFRAELRREADRLMIW